MLITELFRDIYSWKWTEKTMSSYEAQFTTEAGDLVEVLFEQDIGWSEEVSDDPNVPWMVEFSRQKDGGDTEYFYKSAGLTGQGDAYKIFGSVADVIYQFVRIKKPGYLWFTGNEPSRAALYKRMMPRLARHVGMHQIPGNTPNEFWLARSDVRQEAPH